MSSSVEKIKVHEEWEKVMLRHCSKVEQKAPFIGPSTLVPGNNDLCCDLLENICTQPKPIDAKRVCPDKSFPLDIPVFTVQHENKLLCEPHSICLPNGERAHMRACVSGQSCLGNDSSIGNFDKSDGRVLREMLTPEELVKFETKGSVPGEPRLCILCARRCAMVAYFWCLHEKPEVMLRHTIINAYVNPVDCENGYKSEYAIPNIKDGSWRCMIGPVVTNSLSNMYYFKGKDGYWRINQDALAWNQKEKEEEEMSVF